MPIDLITKYSNLQSQASLDFCGVAARALGLLAARAHAQLPCRRVADNTLRYIADVRTAGTIVLFASDVYLPIV